MREMFAKHQVEPEPRPQKRMRAIVSNRLSGNIEEISRGRARGTVRRRPART